MNPQHYTFEQLHHPGRDWEPEHAYARAVELGYIGMGDQPVPSTYPVSVELLFGRDGLEWTGLPGAEESPRPHVTIPMASLSPLAQSLAIAAVKGQGVYRFRVARPGSLPLIQESALRYNTGQSWPEELPIAIGILEATADRMAEVGAEIITESRSRPGHAGQENPHMASPNVTFRSSGPLADDLAVRGDSRSAVASRDLRRYYASLHTAFAAAGLAPAELDYLRDILNGTLLDQSTASMLWMEVADAEPAYAAKWGIDQAALAARLRELPPFTCLAIADAVERWWHARSSERAAG